MGDVGLSLYPLFVRGEAFLAAHQGSEARAEFQKIIDHRGVVLYEPIGALAHLGLARAYVLQGDTAKAKTAYQDFLALWKDADPDIPIAIQTTRAKLRESVGGLPVERVTYQIPGISKRTPTVSDLVTKKRPMFAYEQEVRVFLDTDRNDDTEVLGHPLEWDPEKNVESIRVHPEADNSFMETVVTAVDHYAPSLKDRIAWSAMNARPPF